MHVRVLNLGWRWCDGLDRQQKQCENTNNCEKVYCCIFSSSLAQKSIAQRVVLLFSMFCTVALMLNRLLITEVHAHKNIIFSSFLLHLNLCLCTRSIHWRWKFVTLKLICKTTAWWVNAEPETSKWKHTIWASLDVYDFLDLPGEASVWLWTLNQWHGVAKRSQITGFNCHWRVNMSLWSVSVWVCVWKRRTVRWRLTESEWHLPPTCFLF